MNRTKSNTSFSPGQFNARIYLLCVTILLYLCVAFATMRPISAASVVLLTPTLTVTPMPTVFVSASYNLPFDAETTAAMSKRTKSILQNIKTLKILYNWPAHFGAVTGLTFQKGNILISAANSSSSDMPSIRLSVINNSGVSISKKAFNNAVSNLGSPIQHDLNGNILVGAFGAHVSVWDATGRSLNTIPQLYSSSAVPIENTSFILVGGTNGVIVLWEVGLPPTDYSNLKDSAQDNDVPPSNLQVVDAIHLSEEIIQVVQNGKNTQAFVLGRSGKLYLYSYKANEMGNPQSSIEAIVQDQQDAPSKILQGIGAYIAVQDDQHNVIYAGSHQDIIIYNYTGKYQSARYALETSVVCLSYNKQNGLLLFGDASGVLHFTNIGSNEAVTTVNTGEDLTSCAFNDEGNLIATGNSHGEIKLWGTF